jgi:hypothetical protein
MHPKVASEHDDSGLHITDCHTATTSTPIEMVARDRRVDMLRLRVTVVVTHC